MDQQQHNHCLKIDNDLSHCGEIFSLSDAVVKTQTYFSSLEPS